jgi:hypothetical protein
MMEAIVREDIGLPFLGWSAEPRLPWCCFARPDLFAIIRAYRPLYLPAFSFEQI